MFTQSAGLSAFSNQRQEASYHFSDLASGIARNISKFAIPIIAIAAMSNIPGADAGPVAYTVCTAWCMALATPVLLPGCILACIPVGVAPTV
ncbi:MAG: hypothetical protein Q8L98_07920 [Chlamydiales bacterium]|nr:hypothetical protein [Chlamydiales bacterium]